MNSLAEQPNLSQTRREFYNPVQAQPRQILSAFRARRVKRRLISAYCNGKLSEAAVERAFEIFPELRSA
jgi:hypothetical protein